LVWFGVYFFNRSEERQKASFFASIKRQSWSDRIGCPPRKKG